MMAEVKIDYAALDKMAREKGEAGLRGALGKAESLLKAKILDQPGSGRKYGKHTASAPGESPAKDTGNLSANTNADPGITSNGNDITGTITANTEYAEALEKGSKHSARSRTADALFGMQGRYGPARLSSLASEVGTERMAARPYLSLLTTEYFPDLQKAFVDGAKQ